LSSLSESGTVGLTIYMTGPRKSVKTVGRTYAKI
jgi:hypothetical protein